MPTVRVSASTSRPTRSARKVSWALQILKTYRPELLSAEALNDGSAVSDG